METWRVFRPVVVVSYHFDDDDKPDAIKGEVGVGIIRINAKSRMRNKSEKPHPDTIRKIVRNLQSVPEGCFSFVRMNGKLNACKMSPRRRRASATRQQERGRRAGRLPFSRL